MAVLADLGTGADGRPRIDHGAFIDVGAEVHEGRQQHDAGGDVRRTAHDAPGHGAEAGATEVVGGHAVEFGGHLVPPRRPAGGAGDGDHVVEAERQQHRLLQPLVDLPAIGALLGDAHLALVQEVERLIDRVADDAGRAGGNTLALLPHRLDRALQLGGIHVLGHWAPRDRHSSPDGRRCRAQAKCCQCERFLMFGASFGYVALNPVGHTRRTVPAAGLRL